MTLEDDPTVVIYRNDANLSDRLVLHAKLAVQLRDRTPLGGALDNMELPLANMNAFSTHCVHYQLIYRGQ